MKKLILALALTLPLAVSAAEPAAAKKDAATQAAPAIAKGTGIVKGYDASMGRIILAHDPIPAVKWPAMVMSFRISAELAKGLKDGQKVEFEFQPRDMDGTITKVKVLP